MFRIFIICAGVVMASSVSFQTSMGDFVVELDEQHAPLSVQNFLNYVNSGFYDNTIFHRVIDGFMIQGGGFTESLEQKSTNAPIALESQNGLKNVKYSVAMARTFIPDSATSQFFINVVDNPMLDYPNPDGNGYAVFANVVSGTEVIDAIKAVPTGMQNAMADVPKTAVIIYKATVIN